MRDCGKPRAAILAAVFLGVPGTAPSWGQETGGTIAVPTQGYTSFAAVGFVGAEESNLRLRGPLDIAVRRAIQGASLRLEEPRCQQMFSEFSDAAGRPLQATLDELGETPVSYLRGLVRFYDGSSQRRCTSGWVLGGTRPGSRIVYVCPSLLEADRWNKLSSEVFIIHETLHSLGLGENPPTPEQIDWRVMTRCPPSGERRPSARQRSADPRSLLQK